MSNGVGCHWFTERVELEVASTKFDNHLCAGCGHHHDCKMLREGEVRKPKGGSQGDSY